MLFFINCRHVQHSYKVNKARKYPTVNLMITEYQCNQHRDPSAASSRRDVWHISLAHYYNAQVKIKLAAKC